VLVVVNGREIAPIDLFLIGRVTVGISESILQGCWQW